MDEVISIMRKAIYSKEHKFLVERLRRARRQAGFGQAQVARLLGVSQSYVSKVESGQRRIDVVQLRQFAEVYGKNIDFFME